MSDIGGVRGDIRSGTAQALICGAHSRVDLQDRIRSSNLTCVRKAVSTWRYRAVVNLGDDIAIVGARSAGADATLKQNATL
jgi:hypothetical protein